MGGKSGGGGGAGAMLEYGDKALGLQKQIYDENKKYIQPYYQAGLTGLDQLMMRLGLASPNTAKTEAQIRQELLPSYTAQTQTPGGIPQGAKPLNKLGALGALGLFDLPGRPNNLKDIYQIGQQYFATDPTTGLTYTVNTKGMGGSGDSRGNRPSWYLYGGGGSQPTVDNNALNQAVQAQLAAQTASQQQAAQNPLFGSLLQNYTGQDIYNDPSYDFRFREGNKAAERALAAQGKYLTPAGAQALMGYGQDLASTEYQNAYNRYVNDQTNIYNRLANIAGLGQTATGQLTGVGTNYANAGTDLYTGMGNAITAANQAKAANRGSMFNTLLGIGGNLGMAYLTGGGSLFGGSAAAGGFVSDKRLKENIELVGQENGHNVYKFTYKNSDTPFIGVMAQEVIKTNPDAVIMNDNGYYSVNYDKIGVTFRSA